MLYYTYNKTGGYSMKILIINLKENITKRVQVKTVMNRGLYFTVVYEDGKKEDYNFKSYDYFINH
jgi:hypothetical protein